MKPQRKAYHPISWDWREAACRIEHTFDRIVGSVPNGSSNQEVKPQKILSYIWVSVFINKPEVSNSERKGFRKSTVVASGQIKT